MEMLLDCGRINSVLDYLLNQALLTNARATRRYTDTHEVLYQILLGVGSLERLAAYCAVLPPIVVLGF